ncbi:MAG: NADH-quinone oxidoreductase subunit J [Gammaproteobacteria bacterium]
MTKIIFYLFALVLVAASLRVITARNPVHAALSLVLAFVACSGLWLLVEAEFLAVVLVLVYVGAVMVLFLFVVMMLDINLVPLREGFIRYLPVGVLVALLIVVQLVMVLGPSTFGLEFMPKPLAMAADYSNTEELGVLLYTVYVYPFEIAAVLLLVAIVAAISLTMRRRGNTRTQRPEEQVRVQREDRIRLVDMPSEDER